MVLIFKLILALSLIYARSFPAPEGWGPGVTGASFLLWFGFRFGVSFRSVRCVRAVSAVRQQTSTSPPKLI